MGIYNKESILNNLKRVFARRDIRLKLRHPLVGFVYFAGVFTFVFIFAHPLFLGTVFIYSILLTFYCGAKLNIRGYLFIALFIIILNPLINHRGVTILFYFLDNPVTAESVVYGILTAVMICSVMILFGPFNAIIDSERFLFLFSRAIPKTAFLTGMTLRFSDLFVKRGRSVIEVQSNKGVNIKSIKGAALSLSALTVWSLEEGMCAAQTLKAKNYGGARRTHYALYRLRALDITLTALMILLFTVVIIMRIADANPYNPLRAMYDLNFDPIAYLLMIVYLSVPFLLGLKRY